MFKDIGEEFRGAELGDRRRSARLERIGERLAVDPSRSFPDAMASEGALEGLYRFLNNDDVSVAGILGPHTRMTAQRCDEHADVLVLHDTTSLEFSGERSGLGRLQTVARNGFFFHASLAVTPAREPLGVVAAETWVRNESIRGRNKRQLRKDPKRESLRWVRGVVAAEAALDRAGRAVHVMDREGDNYDLFSHLQAESTRHVIRLAHNRNLIGTAEKLKDRAVTAPCVFRREVQVSRRPKKRDLDKKAIHPERGARIATLAVSAVELELRRSNNHSVPRGSPESGQRRSSERRPTVAEVARR